jgi:sugar/nucleoside kinase (ribokinase family)
LLPHVDIFLPNEREALALTRTENIEEALEHLARLSKTVAIKLGAQGALARAANEQIRVPSIPVRVTDTVGAGDAFDAGFLYGWLNDWSLGRSLQLACACGALSTQAPGGTQGQPTLDEARQHVAG